MRYITRLMIVILSIGLLSCEKKAEDKEPVASFSVDPLTGPFTTVFIFDGSQSYNEGESPEDLFIRWDWDGDGEFDTQFSKQKIHSHRYEEIGDYEVLMEVRNSIGWTDSEVYPVSVYADSILPVADFSVYPDTSSVMTIFRFDASESWDAYTEMKDLKFRWDWQGDSIWDTPFCTDTIIHHKYTIPGSYHIRMEVKNSFNLTDTASQNIFVFDI